MPVSFTVINSYHFAVCWQRRHRDTWLPSQLTNEKYKICLDMRKCIRLTALDEMNRNHLEILFSSLELVLGLADTSLFCHFVTTIWFLREVKCSEHCAAHLKIISSSLRASMLLDSFSKPENGTYRDKFHAMLGLKDKAAALLRHISHVTISSSRNPIKTKEFSDPFPGVKIRRAV